MKKIMIATNFSANARHAAEYGYQLARQIKAGVFLCNIVTIPAETPMAGLVVWPQFESDELLEDSIDELKRLKAHLEQNNYTETFNPPVGYLNDSGKVNETVPNAAIKQNVDLIISGEHEPGEWNALLLGNHTHDLIEAGTKPLLIVPGAANFKPIKKIAFAIDFEHPENDQEQIYQLIDFARLLNAEILLTHITDAKLQSHGFEKSIEQFLAEISNKADYPQIYYRAVKQDSIEAGLNWLCEYGQIDMLAMVHRQHGFFDNLLNGSHTKKMAGHITIPLLVFPTKK